MYVLLLLLLLGGQWISPTMVVTGHILPPQEKKTNDNITLMGNFPSDQRTYTTSQNHEQRRTETKSSRNNKNNLQPNKHFLFVLTGSICRVVLSHTGISERELTQPISLGLNVVIGSHNR